MKEAMNLTSSDVPLNSTPVQIRRMIRIIIIPNMCSHAAVQCLGFLVAVVSDAGGE